MKYTHGILGLMLHLSTLLTQSVAYDFTNENVFVSQSQQDNTINDIPGLFEEDIIPDYETISSSYGYEFANKLVKDGMIENNNTISTRGTAPGFPLWREEYNNLEYYVIPIFLDPGYSVNARNLIIKSLKVLMRKTAVVRFRFLKKKPTNGRSFMHIGAFGSSGCASYVGRRPDKATSSNGQQIWIGSQCMKRGIIQHEVMHAMGFWHEQSRPDRDQYVDIYTSNVRSEYTNNFSKQSSVNSLGAPYDYDSVLHYSPYHFSRNGQKTITAKGNDYRIGQREDISAGDKLQVRLLYQCSTGPQTYAKFMEDKCTSTCKCGLKIVGCNHPTKKYPRDFVCKGNLRCVKNRCVK